MLYLVWPGVSDALQFHRKQQQQNQSQKTGDTQQQNPYHTLILLLLFSLMMTFIQLINHVVLKRLVF